jgi:hypothetical protein
MQLTKSAQGAVAAVIWLLHWLSTQVPHSLLVCASAKALQVVPPPDEELKHLTSPMESTPRTNRRCQVVFIAPSQKDRRSEISSSRSL